MTSSGHRGTRYGPGRALPLLALLLARPSLAAIEQPPAPAKQTPHAAVTAARPPQAPARHGAGQRPRGAHAGRRQAAKGPPPPAWTISPRHHQTPVSATGYADGDRAPWTARWGCVSPASPAAGLVGAIGIADQQLTELVVSSGVDGAGDSGCVPYALLTSDDSGLLALAVVAAGASDTVPRVLLFTRDAPDGSFTVRSESSPASPLEVRITTVEGGETPANSEAPPADLPAALNFEVATLGRAMLADSSVVDPDNVRVRIAFEAGADAKPPRLLSMELLDRATNRVLKQALWIDREDMPGGFFSPNGESFEQPFWTNPVNFRYISRGVGASSLRLRRPAPRPAQQHHKPAAQPRMRHEMHIGVDFVAPTGTPVVAVADGRVLFEGYFGGYGNLVIVEHPGGYTTHYGHLSAFASTLTVGTDVRRGTTLGNVGMTGLATGPHLHFEIRRQGAYVDPLDTSQPMALWSLRRADYASLASRILSTAAILMAPPSSAPPTAEEPAVTLQEPPGAIDGGDGRLPP